MLEHENTFWVKNGINYLHKYVKIPRKYLDLDINSMKLSLENDNRIIDVLDNLNKIGDDLLQGNYFKDPVFLILQGKFGVGKTRVGCYLTKKSYECIIVKKYRLSDYVKQLPLFVRASEVVNYKFLNNDNKNFRDRLFNSVFLFIDDILRVVEFKGDFDFIHQIIENRYDNNLSTIVSLNSPLDKLNGMQPRFVDFMSQFKSYTLIGKTRLERKRNGN